MPPPPPYRHWYFLGLGDEPLLVQPVEAPRDLGWEVLDPMFVVAFLDRWLLEPESRATLYDLHVTLFGGLATSAWGLGEERLSLLPLLLRAFERQDLVVLAARRRNAVLPGQPPAPPSSRPPPLSVKTFIEIVLLDADSRPVAGEAFEITLPDGQVRTGRLDQNGFSRIDGIDPGTCDVRFPGIDGREWGRSLERKLNPPKLGS
jgi:hypothetical protein